MYERERDTIGCGMNNSSDYNRSHIDETEYNKNEDPP